MLTPEQANTSAASKTRERLKKRTAALKMVRSFFDNKGFLEVDVPALSPFASIDSYIDLIETKGGGFLHSSPEYALKRLLCEDSGDIYFLGHVYRKEEEGKLHASEFSMIEWYRTNFTEEAFLDEVIELLCLFLGPQEVERLDFDEAYKTYSNPIPEDIDISKWSEEDQFFYTWAHDVEPRLGQDKITIISNFPKEHAVLAKTHLVNGEEKARRYEFYYHGIELANGFDELSCPLEHKKRFEESNAKRLALGKKAYPIDTLFLEALKNGSIKDHTYGMAAGFDRLLMLMQKKEDIQDILSLPS